LFEAPFTDTPLFDDPSLTPFFVGFLPRYTDMGTIVVGKLQSGAIKRGQKLVVMPNKVR